MAILDSLTQFSSSQAVTSTGDTDSDNVVDQGTAGQAFGSSARLRVHVVEACASEGEATVAVSLQHCATVGGSYETVLSSRAYPVAALAAGALLLDVNLSMEGLKRFLKLVYTVAEADLTAGKFTAAFGG